MGRCTSPTSRSGSSVPTASSAPACRSLAALRRRRGCATPAGSRSLISATAPSPKVPFTRPSPLPATSSCRCSPSARTTSTPSSPTPLPRRRSHWSSGRSAMASASSGSTATRSRRWRRPPTGSSPSCERGRRRFCSRRSRCAPAATTRGTPRNTATSSATANGPAAIRSLSPPCASAPRDSQISVWRRSARRSRRRSPRPWRPPVKAANPRSLNCSPRRRRLLTRSLRPRSRAGLDARRGAGQSGGARDPGMSQGARRPTKSESQKISATCSGSSRPEGRIQR